MSLIGLLVVLVLVGVAVTFIKMDARIATTIVVVAVIVAVVWLLQALGLMGYLTGARITPLR